MVKSNQSTAIWVERLKAGSDQAVRSLYRDIFDAMIGVARRQLGGKGLRWADEEDIALSAFESFCAAAADGKFPALQNRNDVRKLLITITARKAKAYLRHQYRRRRGGNRVRGESAFHNATDSRGGAGIDGVGGRAHAPDIAFVVIEECERLLEHLGDDSLRTIAIWKLEGYTDAEIATRLGIVTRTVERKTARIRAIWERELGS